LGGSNEPRRLLQVAVNGARTAAEHPAIPRTPDELAAAARAAVDAGAHIVHLHAYDADGVETLAAEACTAALRAVRAACPGVPISLTTSAAIEPDEQRRLDLVGRWTELPELVTANQGEPGIVELCAHLMARGVGIEAGLLSLDDAEAFVGARIADRCVRVLLEPPDADPVEAVAHAAAMENPPTDRGRRLPALRQRRARRDPARRRRLARGDPPRSSSPPARLGGLSAAALLPLASTSTAQAIPPAQASAASIAASCSTLAIGLRSEPAKTTKASAAAATPRPC
jgi:hypothetical protein